jgi:hypothetical protein
VNAVEGLFFGLSLVAGLGGERVRWGASADAAAQWFGESPSSPLGPTGTLEAHVGFAGPALFSEVAAGAGGLVQAGDFDGGYQTLIGARAAVGLGLSTDGAAGPLVLGGVQLPYFDGRVEQWWAGDRFAPPRLSAGVSVNTECCFTFTGG